MHPSYVRQHHATEIFHALRQTPQMSKREISEAVGCDKTTVSAILKRFEELGLVRREMAESRGRGRPSEVFALSQKNGLLIGTHLEFDQAVIVAAGIDGQRLARVDMPLPRRPEDFATDLRNAIFSLCASLDRDISEIRCVGITLPGLVQTDGALAHSSSLDWYDVDAKGLLREMIGAPIHIDNDTNAAMLAEHLFGECAHLEDFVYLDSVVGLGGGIFMDGHPYRGRKGFAGEIGHLKVVPDGRTCGCGASGCLSAYLSQRALIQKIRKFEPVDSIGDVLSLAAAGNRNVLRILNNSGRYLGLALSDITNVLNPAAVVLAGHLARLWPYLEAQTRQVFEENAMSASFADTEILISDLSLAEIPAGGVALALEGFSSLDGQDAPPW